MSTDFDDLLDATVDIYRAATAEGDLGSAQSATHAESTADVAAAIQPLTSHEVSGAGGVSDIGTHQMWCASTVDVIGGDWVKDGDVYYEVIGPAQDHSAVSLGLQKLMLRYRETS